MTVRHFLSDPSTANLLEINIPVSFVYGSGVFTTFVAIPDNVIFMLKSHYERLKRDCNFFNISFPWDSFKQFEEKIQFWLKQYPTRPVVMRITIIPTDAGVLSNYELHKSLSSVHVLFRPPTQCRQSIRAKTVKFDRLFPQHKHISHIAERFYLTDAKSEGYDDYIRVSSSGHLTESAYANLFLMASPKHLLTPSVDEAGCLPGIMREAIMTRCTDLGINVEEGLYTPDLIQITEGAFLCNAVKGAYAINCIDDKKYDISKLKDCLKKIMLFPYFQNMTLQQN